MVDAIRLCVLSKKIMARHARRRPTFFMMSTGDDGMPLPTLSNRVFNLKSMMACHAGDRPTVYVV